MTSSPASSLTTATIAGTATSLADDPRLADYPPAKIQHLAQYASMLEDPMTRLEGATQLRRLISVSGNKHLQQLIDVAGVLPSLVRILSDDSNTTLQVEAAWVLTNVAAGTSQHTKHVVDLGAVPIFVRLLSSACSDLCSQAVWALGNISGDGSAMRDLVLAAGALQPLLGCLAGAPSIPLHRNVAWTLGNLCRKMANGEHVDFESVRAALPALGQMLLSKDADVLSDACWALSYLSDGPDDRAAAVVGAGVCGRLVELLAHASPAVVASALRAVGNLVAGSEAETQAALDSGAAPRLVALLRHTRPQIRKGAAWALSNVTAGTAGQRQAVIDNGGIAPLVYMLAHDHRDARREAAHALSNVAIFGSPAQCLHLVASGTVPPLVRHCCHHSDRRSKQAALQGLWRLCDVDGVGEPVGDAAAWAILSCDGVRELTAAGKRSVLLAHPLLMAAVVEAEAEDPSPFARALRNSLLDMGGARTDLRVIEALPALTVVDTVEAHAANQAFSGMLHRGCTVAPLAALSAHGQDACTVCCEPFKVGDVVTSLPSCCAIGCRAFFHRSGDGVTTCAGVSKWLEQHASCPLCRTPCTATYLPEPDPEEETATVAATDKEVAAAAGPSADPAVDLAGRLQLDEVAASGAASVGSKGKGE